MIALDYQSRVPIYRQIQDRVLELILLGVYTSDTQLPSVRSLAVELGINPNTIQKAYQELEQDGIIYTVTGKGSFVRGVERAKEQLRQKSIGQLRQALRDARLAHLSLDQALELVHTEYRNHEVNHHD